MSAPPPERVLPEAEAVKAGSVLSSGNVVSAQLPQHHGLIACHRACCHRLPGGPRAAGATLGALRSPHSQASRGDSPQSQGGAAAVAGGRSMLGQSECPMWHDSPRRGERGPRPAGRGAAVWDALVTCWVFRERCHSDRQSVTLWNPFLGTVSGGGANIIISRQ